MPGRIAWICGAAAWCAAIPWLSAGKGTPAGQAARTGPPAPRSAASRPAATRPAAPRPASQPATYRGPKVRFAVRPKPGRYLRIDQRQLMQTLALDTQAPAPERRNWHAMTISGELVIPPPDAAGQRKVSFTCRGVEQTVGIGEAVRRYSSAGPPDKQDEGLLQQWRPLIGWQGARILADDGRSHKLEGIVALLSGVEPGPKRAERCRTLRDLATSLLTELGGGWWARLIPAEAVAPGDAWQATVFLPTEPALGPVSMTCDCLLQDIVSSEGRRTAVIDFAGAAQVEARGVDPRVLVDLPVKVRMRDVRLDLSGRLQFDLDAGLATALRRELTAKAKVLVVDTKDTTARLKMTIRANYEQTLQVMR